MMDRKDFDKAFRDYYEELFYFARQYIADAEECSDIVTAVFEDIWKSAPYITKATIRALLYLKVRSKCIDYLRTRDRRNNYINYVSIMSESYINNNEYEEKDEREKTIRRIINNLQPPKDEIFKAVFFKGKKYQEIANDMNISLSAVKKHMSETFKLIKEISKKD